MTRQQRASRILELLKQEIPDPKPALVHKNAYELLIATILSAQTTDARVNMVTPILFTKYPMVQALAAAGVEDIARIIKSIGLYNSKAKNIHAAALKIVQDFDGEVPDNMEGLLTLPGVARKTASVVLWQWFGKNEGFTVDTHVIRLANWFGLTGSKDPKIIEKDLMQLFPRDEWGLASLRLVLLGRTVLTARNPQYQGTVWEEYLVNINRTFG